MKSETRKLVIFAVRFGAVLAVILGVVGHYLSVPLVGLLVPQPQFTLVTTGPGVYFPLRCALGSAACGASIGIGAVLWSGSRGKRRLVWRVAVLLGVACVAVLVTALRYRLEYQYSYQRVRLAGLTGLLPVSESKIPVGKIGLAGAAAALAAGCTAAFVRRQMRKARVGRDEGGRANQRGGHDG
jgi:hypothetical protein